MLLAGGNITSQNDKLNKITVDYLYNSLRNPRPEILSKIRQLRIVRNLDTKQYSQLKRQLPYIVCGIFSPLFRRTENFAYTEYFMVDIDHLSDKDIDISELRERINKNESVVLSFESPSGDGLKVLFRLKERCYDSGIYSLFYKSFVSKFAMEMHLEQVVDTRTSDVCRACFISVDPNVFYRRDAIAVNLDDYLNTDNSLELFNLKHELDKKQVDTSSAEIPKSKDPDSEVLAKIKGILNPKSREVKRKEQQYFVPEEITQIIDDLRLFVEETGVQLYEMVNIQYGKKLRFRLGHRLAEINLFYGKRGFNAVISPRSGTNADFNQTILELINVYLSENA
ncbi:MAG: CRISPR-associated primase-polymerase type B [bacterium]